MLRFFKTNKGDYGEGDKFYGIASPQIRKIACKYKPLDCDDIERLVKSNIHEKRAVALIIMTLRYPKEKDKIYDLYLKNIKYVNNWDLVDMDESIVGDVLEMLVGLSALVPDEKVEEITPDAEAEAAAIMKKMRQGYYKGGAILEHRDQDDINSHDSIYSDDSDEADLNRNAEEDANEELNEVDSCEVLNEVENEVDNEEDEDTLMFGDEEYEVLSPSEQAQKALKSIDNKPKQGWLGWLGWN